MDHPAQRPTHSWSDCEREQHKRDHNYLANFPKNPTSNFNSSSSLSYFCTLTGAKHTREIPHREKPASKHSNGDKKTFHSRQMKNDGNCGCFNSFSQFASVKKSEQQQKWNWKWAKVKTHRSEKLKFAWKAKHTKLCENFISVSAKKKIIVLFPHLLCPPLQQQFRPLHRKMKWKKWAMAKAKNLEDFFPFLLPFFLLSFSLTRCNFSLSQLSKQPDGW